VGCGGKEELNFRTAGWNREWGINFLDANNRNRRTNAANVGLKERREKMNRRGKRQAEKTHNEGQVWRHMPTHAADWGTVHEEAHMRGRRLKIDLRSDEITDLEHGGEFPLMELSREASAEEEERGGRGSMRKRGGEQRRTYS
jgi:hypothetical protein